MNSKHLGKNQLKAFAFISQIAGWHSFHKDARKTIQSLVTRNLVEINEFNQFRLA